MGQFFAKFGAWLRSAYSEPDGTGSSSRLITTGLSVFSSVLLYQFFQHLYKITDLPILTILVSAIPTVVGALILFSNSPYFANQLRGSIGDIVASILTRRTAAPQQPARPEPPQQQQQPQ